MDWTNLAQDRNCSKTLVNTIMNLRGPIQYLEILA
jgi:hypothetical protein